MAFAVELYPVSAEKQKDFEKQLLKDFYLSFKFSQGDQYTQGYILNALVSNYRSQGDYDPAYIRENSNELFSKLIDFGIPKSHVTLTNTGEKLDLTPSLKAAVFINGAKIFVDKLKTGEPSMPQDLNAEAMMRGIIQRDIVYQTAERGYQAADPHSSYFRQNVLLQQPTGSEAYNQIFARCLELIEVDQYRNVFLTVPIAERITDLAQGWEANHPGVAFYVGTSS